MRAYNLRERKGVRIWKLLNPHSLAKLPLLLAPFTYLHVGDAAIGNPGLFYALWVQGANP
jgi:hypothetical protein